MSPLLTPQPPTGGDDKTPSEQPEHQKATSVENDGADPTPPPSEPPSEGPTNNDPDKPDNVENDNKPKQPEEDGEKPSQPEADNDNKSPEPLEGEGDKITPEAPEDENKNEPHQDDTNKKPENDIEKQDPESSQNEQEDGKPKGPCADGLCDCFKDVADATKSLDELKEAIRNTIDNPDATNKEINDTLIKNMDDLSDAQKTSLIIDVAREDFNGDVAKAKSHVEAVNRLEQFERQHHAERQAEKDARDTQREARFEAAKKEDNSDLTDTFKKRGVLSMEKVVVLKGRMVQN